MDHVPLEDADERLKTPFRNYVKQKGWGKGFTDWSLLIANANQLHFVLTHPDAHLRNLETVFLSLSIILQVNMTYSILCICIKLCGLGSRFTKNLLIMICQNHNLEKLKLKTASYFFF